jgi:hypothetical protein
MAAVTTGQLLVMLHQVCHRSYLVDYVIVQAIDADTLNVRIHLTRAGAFIKVFYNVTTDRTAFALVENEQRVYGVDNAKMGWHVHPFADPTQHVACAPTPFEEFLTAVEAHYCEDKPCDLDNPLRPEDERCGSEGAA